MNLNKKIFILFDCYKKFSEDGVFTLSDDNIIALADS